MSCTTFPSKHSAPLPSIASKTTWSVLLLSQSAAAARDPMRWLLKKLASSGSEATCLISPGTVSKDLERISHCG